MRKQIQEVQNVLALGSDNAPTGGIVWYVKKKEETQVVGGGNNRMNDLKDCYFSSALISQYHFSTINSAKQCQTVPTLSHTRNFSKIF